ncbi:cell surface hyaluronidase isoform X1 [Crotalus tigris]|uniref:cell surface hyaluronidase isoform X1 n=2 Tax=Crotalus tigris TaxID=88082 RepID=UPI00192FA91D|nr:cell surface hyaluronidase isoform X1 [Crotalus tigris]XP_039217625.1 cell surface hyaluronidase isoform X1 [Crotalus tigris]
MHTAGPRGSSPSFLQAQNGSSYKSGYVPGRVVPLRPPPPPNNQASAKFSCARQEARATVASPGDRQRYQAEASRKNRHKNTFICFAMSSFSFFIALGIILGIASKYAPDENCPDQNPRLKNWNPGHDREKRIVVQKGDLFRLNVDATVHSIVIQDGGLLVFGDDENGSKYITLKTRFILIKDGGMLHIGAEKCRYKSKATIILYGKLNEGDYVPTFGEKFVGVGPGGTLELHGSQKLSWTSLSKTLYSSGLASGSYTFENEFFRALHVRVIDQDTAEVLETERFDTHESHNDSKRLEDFLKTQHFGRIVAIAVADSAAKNLLEETKRIIQDLLGSKLVKGLSYRQAWALVSVIGDGNSSCNESVRDYENHNTGGQALAEKEFFTVDGQKFIVRAFSEWIAGVPKWGFQVKAVHGVIMDLSEDVSSWEPGDQIVVASTDYSMYQTEEFTLLPCPECNKYQVKVKEMPQFLHMGEIVDGVDMRAEVGILTRNIIITGKMEDSCYTGKDCRFFSYDTFGGHIKILKNFTSVHLSHVELKQMGQQIPGSYPVHFYLCGDVDEKGGYTYRTYVEGLSIHHCFSRCVSIHGTNGLLIKDTVGYNTLGHCFFMEDGIEQRNILFHNLGLVTKPGTLLPTDRNSTMCTAIRDHVYGNYEPVPATDCMAVSTFWIAHPNNNLISNVAAGSQDAGIWYIFHKVPTGDSHGLFLETKAELTPLGIFYNNKVHSNFKAGLFIDKGVKITNASATDKREYLSLDTNARFRPHQDANPEKPRVAALIERLIAYKNNDHGAWVRGGDIIIQNSGFADNGIGLTFASDGSFPSDEGSSQEVSNSLFVGESKNYGYLGGQNKYWGTGGVNNKTRTLPRNRTYPIRGFQIYDGPIRLTKCTFNNFVPTTDRFTSAIGFPLKNTWQITPQNNISLVAFGENVSLKVFFGKPGPWFEEADQDGDKNSIFHDVDGSVTGFKDTYVGRMDNYLIRHPDCSNFITWNGVVCSGTFAQVYIQTRNPQNLIMTMVRDEYPSNPMILRGINNQKADFQQYQPVVMLQKGYTIHWNGQSPQITFLYLINFNKNDWIRVGLCYPPDASFQVTFDVFQRQASAYYNMEDYVAVSSMAELQKRRTEKIFYFDDSTGLLFLFLQAKYHREGHSYCSSQGCERVKIQASFQSKSYSNCSTNAYPKYFQKPTAVKRMPTKITNICLKCGSDQVVFTSDPHQTYIFVKIQTSESQEYSISVNDVKFPLKKVGLLAIVIDACLGKVTKETFFPEEKIKLIENYIKTGIPQRSVVVLTSRGNITSLNISEALTTLGVAKPPNLHNAETIRFLGFRGNFKPSWVKFFTGSAEEDLGAIEKYIPLQLEEYGCGRVNTSKRKDLELLKQALRIQ